MLLYILIRTGVYTCVHVLYYIYIYIYGHIIYGYVYTYKTIIRAFFFWERFFYVGSGGVRGVGPWKETFLTCNLQGPFFHLCGTIYIHFVTCVVVGLI